MFKNALVFRIAQWELPSLTAVEERLEAARFAPCGATQAESAGWVEPRGEQHGPLVESVAGQWVLKLVVERKAVPSSVVKGELEVLLDKAEKDTGRRPRGKQAKEMKEQIVHDLLPRAFPKKSATLVWIDAKNSLVLVDAASNAKADRIATMLIEALGGGIVLKLLEAQTSPAVAMAEWLKSKEAPAGFTIDRECELKQPDSEKASVRYARHTLDIDEVAAHIEQGKFPTQLAMTWEGRVSFVLHESMTIKKIKLLDVKTESGGKDDDGFDADVAIATGELGKLLADLIIALGGEMQRGEPAPAPVAADTEVPWDVEPAAA
jgi:recombination associated protein RdgC